MFVCPPFPFNSHLTYWRLVLIKDFIDKELIEHLRKEGKAHRDNWRTPTSYH